MHVAGDRYRDTAVMDLADILLNILHAADAGRSAIVVSVTSCYKAKTASMDNQKWRSDAM